MKKTLITKIRVAFAASILLLLILSLLSLYSLNLLLKRADWVNHTNEVLIKLENIISLLKDAETGQRGYLVTRNPEFLEPYIGSYQKVFTNYNDVRKLTIDNNHQQYRLDTLRFLINTRFNIIDSAIVLEKSGIENVPLKSTLEKRGKPTMDQIRALIQRMKLEETDLRKVRHLAVKSSSFLTPVLTAVASVLSLIFAVIAYFVLLNDARKRIEAEEKLKETNQKLEDTNEELLTREDQLRKLNFDLEEKVEDVTKEVITGKEQLIQTEERYKTIIEGVKDYAIMMLDPDGYISSWNPGAEKVKGYKESEILGKHFSTFYLDEDIQNKIPEQHLRVAAREGHHEYEGWRIKKDGSHFWASVLISALYDKKDQLIGFIKITRDLTERKTTEEKIRRINNDLDRFIYTASHDLKAPIANLEGLLYSIKDEAMVHCQGLINNELQMMNQSVETLKRIIEEINEINKIHRTVDIPFEEIDLEGVIKEFKAFHSTELTETNTKVFITLEERKVYFSRPSLRYIIDNLMNNAIKFRSPDRTPEIHFNTYEENGGVVMLIRDNGLGMDLRNKDKIFGMFKRLHDHVKGSGIGLYLVRRILENFGGRIEVESEVGKGSTFIIHFPKRNVRR